MKIEPARDLLTASAIFDKKKENNACVQTKSYRRNIIREHKNLSCGEWWIDVRNRAGENISTRHACIKLLLHLNNVK